MEVHRTCEATATPEVITDGRCQPERDGKDPTFPESALSRTIRGAAYYVPLIISLLIMISVEWFGRNGEYALHELLNNKLFRNGLLRAVLYGVSLFLILAFRGGAVAFIYFQF